MDGKFESDFHLDDPRGFQEGLDDLLDGRIHGGGEEESLALRGQQLQDLVHLLAEAQLQELVGLVDHQVSEAPKAQGLLVQQIQQPAWRGDNQIGASPQGHHLGVDGDATEGCADLQGGSQMPGQLHRPHPHLHRQFPGRNEDEDPRRLAWGPSGRIVRQQVEDRSEEGHRLPRTSLGLHRQVVARKHGRNRLFLHGEGPGVAQGLEGEYQFGAKGEAGEGHRQSSWGIGRAVEIRHCGPRPR